MCICNDRRWPETYRVLGLRDAELVMIGYNTPVHYPQAPEHDHLQDFHNELVMQAGAYQNGMWIVGVAKAGKEEDCDLIGGSCIIDPTARSWRRPRRWKTSSSSLKLIWIAATRSARTCSISSVTVNPKTTPRLPNRKNHDICVQT